MCIDRILGLELKVRALKLKLISMHERRDDDQQLKIGHIAAN